MKICRKCAHPEADHHGPWPSYCRHKDTRYECICRSFEAATSS